MSKLSVLDLFSGIGGFSLGLERTQGFKTVAFCEINPFCRRVLARHWPEVPCYDDVRSLTAGRLSERPDLICGGFPCQPFSGASAGKRRGTEDDRFLWPEMLRLVAEARPAWVCAENVTHIGSMALERVVSDLETLGYEVAQVVIPACAIGLDHRRDRVWFLAHADQSGESGLPFHAEVAGVSWSGSVAADTGTAHGISGGLDGHRKRALGNAIVPGIAELIGRAILAAEAQRAQTAA